ncbi:MAG: hypothetical protein RDV41_07675 [Planctomycetota bacterium]|nr:hypothetical protein [Planctomycetota bacterium]
MPLGNKLAGLPALQSIDRQINELEAECRALDARLVPLENEVKKTQTELTELEGRRKEARKNLGMRELALKEKEARLLKLDQQLLTLKTNKEYATMQTEIGSAKADKSALEDEILNSMSALDETDRIIGLQKEKAARAEKGLAAARIEIEAGKGRITELLARLTKEREPALDAVDSRVLEIYERLSKRHADAQVLACVKIDTGAAGKLEGASCGECGVSITTQELSRCMQDKEVMLCKNCSRILLLQ